MRLANLVARHYLAGMKLQDKTIFITGASRGIGRAIALKCAEAGANIVIASKTDTPHPKLPGTIHSVAEEVTNAGGKALALVLDVRDEAGIASAMEKAASHFGGIDCLINNAGAIFLAGTAATPMKRYDLMHSVNVRGTYACSQAALPYLLKGNSPHILNLSPPIDMDPRWLEGHVAYTMSKYGMSMCTLGMSAEFAKSGIAVNSLWPRTIIATDALRMVGGTSLFKMARTPDIMADAAFEIVTTENNELTGQLLIDETFLKTRGVSDFSGYAVESGNELMTDLFVTD